jgi:hypothetical protein
MSMPLCSKIDGLACFLLLGFLLAGQLAANTLSHAERAEKRFESYIKALQEGKEEVAEEFWNKEERDKYRAYDWQWEYLTYRMLDPRHLNYKVVNREEREGYVTLEVEWYYRDGKAGSLQTDIRYFVEENGKMVGANPIFVHTRDWQQKKSKHFLYRYKNKQDKPSRSLLEKMDRFYEKTVDLLEVDFQYRIEYFKCDSPEEVGLLFGLEPSPARSQIFNGVAASVREFVPHEIVHIISYQLLPREEKGIPPEYLNEGLSYWLGGASFFSSELLLSWARLKIEQEDNITLDSLINDPWIYGKNEGAALVTSLVKFLIETYGNTEFKQLFAAGESYDKQRAALTKLYGKSVNQLQEEWKRFVRALDLPEIRFEKPASTKMSFYIEDPLGDDKGDGDYSYPQNQKAASGMFDLIGFEVSCDDEMVYFKLQFVNLISTEISSDEGFNGMLAVIAIDQDDRKGSGNTKLLLDGGNVEFPKRDAFEFAIEVSNVGVLVYDQDWMWRLLFLRPFSQTSHIKDDQIFFAVPQKIIGTPEPDWKYQVLVGGQKGGFVNGTYRAGKFMRVGQRSGPDQGGGGTDTDFNPDVYDILAEREADQEKIQNNYDIGEKRKAVVPLVKLKQKID